MHSGPWPRWWRKRRRRQRTKSRPDRQLLMPGIKPPRRGKEWKAARAECLTRFRTGRCAVCGGPLPAKEIHVDHIVPEQFLFQHGLPNAHAQENLLPIHRRCHGRKKTVEDRLFRGDLLGFLSGLRQLGWPMEQVAHALEFYALADTKRS